MLRGHTGRAPTILHRQGGRQVRTDQRVRLRPGGQRPPHSALARQAQAGSDPWFERVTSKANICDEIRRNDFTMAGQRGWHHAHLNLEPVWPLVLRAADDLDYACGPAFTDMLAAMRPQIARFRPKADDSFPASPVVKLTSSVTTLRTSFQRV